MVDLSRSKLDSKSEVRPELPTCSHALILVASLSLSLSATHTLKKHASQGGAFKDRSDMSSHESNE
jgi:hypothetical protein